MKTELKHAVIVSAPDGDDTGKYVGTELPDGRKEKMGIRQVTVLPYDSAWKKSFEELSARIRDALGGLALRIEHVGSTSVEGLSAKPIIDIDAVIEDSSLLDPVKEALAAIGYAYEGDLGIPGREAFRYEGEESLPEHHLYVCARDSKELHRHIAFRDRLRSHPDEAAEYGRIKKEAARLFPHDIDGYIAHKAPFIEKICRLIDAEEIMTHMKGSHRKIADAVLSKAGERIPGCLDILGVYGSAATGDTHALSDLDLLIVLNDPEKWPVLASTFVVEDEDVAHDIYCTTWEMLESDADCPHANLGRLMDSELLYVRDDPVRERLDGLRKKAADILASDERFGKAKAALQRSFEPYSIAMTSDDIARKRAYSAYTISLLLDAVMLFNGRYFRRGVKRTFGEMEGLTLPDSFRENIMQVIRADDMPALDRALTSLLRSVMDLLGSSGKNEAPEAPVPAGTWEEMYSNWRGKMHEAAEHGDVWSSFINMAFLNYMLEGIAEETGIDAGGLMGSFSAGDLAGNAEAVDEALRSYLREYERAGISPQIYPDTDAFVEDYLSRGGH